MCERVYVSLFVHRRHFSPEYAHVELTTAPNECCVAVVPSGWATYSARAKRQTSSFARTDRGGTHHHATTQWMLACAAKGRASLRQKRCECTRACEHKRVRARLLKKCLTLPLLFSVSVCRLPGSSGRARVSKPALQTAPRAWWSAPRLLAGSKSSTTTSGALCAAASGRKSTPWLLAGNPPPVAVLAAFFYKPTNFSSLPPWLPPMQSCKWRLEGANCVSLTRCTGRWGCRGA